MQLIRGLYNLRQEHRGSVATIGNFDGVHLGHREVVAQLAAEASQFDCQKTLISFEPLPQEFFLSGKAPGRLTTLREKMLQLKHLGVEQLLCLPFNHKLSQMPAEEFIQRVLIDGLDIRSLVVGDDFRFGKNRGGDFKLLKQAGKQHGFPVRDTDTCSIDGERISSSRIRAHLAAGEINEANRLLGRPYSMSGIVIHGDKRGRDIGYPTANIQVTRRVSPLQGIFAVEVAGITDQPLPAVCSIGIRPTVNYRGFLIEVHLLDFNADLYGKRLEVIWLKKLRDETRFDSVAAMVEQIEKDEADARDYFALF